MTALSSTQEEVFTLRGGLTGRELLGPRWPVLARPMWGVGGWGRRGEGEVPASNGIGFHVQVHVLSCESRIWETLTRTLPQKDATKAMQHGWCAYGLWACSQGAAQPLSPGHLIHCSQHAWGIYMCQTQDGCWHLLSTGMAWCCSKRAMATTAVASAFPSSSMPGTSRRASAKLLLH